MLDQGIAAGAAGVQNAAGHGEYFPALVGRKACRDERAAALAGFDNHDATTETADDTVAGWKIVGVRSCAQWIVADHGALFSNRQRQPTVLRRVELVDAATENGERAATGIDSRTVCHRVDTERQPADDGYSLTCQFGC